MSDNLESILCPACGHEMKKIFLPELGINIDICVNGCGGIYFDNRELEKFDNINQNADKILSELKGKIFEKVDGSEIRGCPICGTNMVKNGAVGTDIQIDVCNICGGKFLDFGELEKIREADKAPNSQTFENLMRFVFEEGVKDAIGSKNYTGHELGIEKANFLRKISKIFFN